MSRSQAASCHSLVVRMPGPVDAEELRQRLRTSAGRARADLAGLPLWEEHLPLPAGHPQAAARARREAGRPLRAAGLPLRAVLLRYTDGAADLVLVARHELALDGDPLDVRRVAPEPPAARRNAPEWGLGDPAAAGRTAELPVPLPPGLPGDPALLTGAVALVLARYGTGEAVDEAQDAAGFLAGRPAHPGGLLDLGGIGVLVEDARPGQWRLPRLAPALPGVLHFTRQADGTAAGLLRYHPAELAPVVAERFAAHVAHVAAQLAAGPALPLEQVALLDPAETAHLLALGTTPAAGSAERAARTVDGLFAEIARARPDAVALTAGAPTSATPASTRSPSGPPPGCVPSGWPPARWSGSPWSATRTS